ncbi:nuclear exosome regulator NRDE2 isoform X5 [Dermacentor variabilis]|uniref:nuclear exosome regulator NRDE2 isoform X5 n=1 Tax=Dermacentor variabilis TaxID=34621 RepID=UPI003F5B34B0
MAQGPSLFPAYATTKEATSQSDARPVLFPSLSSSSPLTQDKSDQSAPSESALPDWLCNASYDPALQDLLRRPEQQQDAEEEESSESEESSDASVAGHSPESGEAASNSLSTGERRAKRQHHKKRKRTKRRMAEAAAQPVPEGRRGRQKKIHRYWHRKAFPPSCVANVAQPRLPFTHSEHNLVYVPVCDFLPSRTGNGDVDPLRIHDASTRSYLQGLAAWGNEELQPTNEVLPLLCPEAADKHRSLTDRLRDAPEDERAWLDLAAFQDEYVAAMEEASGVCRTLGRAKAIREKKLQVLEQGLLRTKGSVPLHLQKIQVLLECGEEARAVRAWEELLRVHPGNSRLWLEHARFLQSETTLSGFEVAAASRGYMRALACFRDMLEGRRSTRREPLDVEANIVEVSRQYGVFLCQAGLWERAVATFQALAELSLRCPPQLSEAPLSEALALLEPFWDSGAPRFGDRGALGWAHLMQLGGQAALEAATAQQGTQGEECQRLEDEIVSRRPSLADAWLALESLRDLHQWQPYRPDLVSEEVTSEDPERMVLFEDVGPALFRLRQPAAKLHLFRAWFSLLLGLDLHQSRAGQFGLAEADCFERLPGVNLRMATHFSDALSFPSGWEVRQGVADFVHEVLSQAKPHFVEPTLGDELAQLALRLARLATTWDARKRKKCAKAWLADPAHERNLDLWTEYGLLLIDLGQPQETLAVYEKALDMVSQPGALAGCRGDVWLLLATYLNLRMGVLWHEEETPIVDRKPFGRDEGLLALSWLDSGRKFREVLSSRLQPSALLRAVAAIDNRCRDPAGRTAGAVDVALWMKFFSSGFGAVSALVNEWLDACTKDEEARSTQMAVHTAFIRICTYEVRYSNARRAALSMALLQALEDIPNATTFMWQWVSLSSGSLGALRVRRYLDSLLQKDRSPLTWLVALCFELQRAQVLAKYRTPDASFTLPRCRNHVRRVLERAIELVAHRRCPLLWRLYIELELRLGTRESAKAIFYRALQCCPWAKQLRLVGLQNFPSKSKKLLTQAEVRECKRAVCGRCAPLPRVPTGGGRHDGGERNPASCTPRRTAAAPRPCRRAAGSLASLPDFFFIYCTY